MYKNESTGGRVFIGNLEAAQTRSILDSTGITRVVNCIQSHGPMSDNFHEGMHAGRYSGGEAEMIHYLRFPVADWVGQLESNASGEVVYGAAARHFQPMFEWVDEGLSEGTGVLIHCLAGAHRAGTTGVAFVMHAIGARHMEAMSIVKQLRPVVDPFGTLLKLLRLLDRDLYGVEGDGVEGDLAGAGMGSSEALAKALPRYRKMAMVGVPLAAIRRRMKEDGQSAMLFEALKESLG